LIGSTADYKHQSLEEDCWMLISMSRLFGLLLIRSFHPIPLPISMSSNPPAIIQSRLILRSPPKHHHHAICRSRITQRSWVINPNLWRFTGTFQLHPEKWCPFNI
jgi:hypothetical protein